MIAGWVWMSLVACRSDVAADFHLTIRPHLLPDQEEEVLAMQPDVKLLVITDGAPPEVHYAGVASPGGQLELDGFGPIEAGTTIGLAFERPGGDEAAWNRRSTVAYGSAVVDEVLGAGGHEIAVDILAQRVDAFSKVVKYSDADRKLGGAAAILPDGRAYLFGGGNPDAKVTVDTGLGPIQIISSDSILATGPTPDGWAVPELSQVAMPPLDYPQQLGDDPVNSGARCDAVAIPVETSAGWRILVTGGRYTYGYSAYNAPAWFVWDPDRGEVESEGDLTYGRSSHLAIPVGGGKVLLFGGFSGAGPGGLVSYEILTVGTGKTQVGGHSFDLKGNFGSYGTALGNKAVICPGGNLNGDTINPVSQCVRIDGQDGFSELADLPEPLYGASIAALPDGGLLVTGGVTGTIGLTTLAPATNKAYRWNPSTDTWHEVGVLQHPRGYHQSVLLNDGRVLVVGGVDELGGVYGLSGATIRCTETFDPDLEIFTETDCTDAGSGQEASVSVAGDYVVAFEGISSPSATVVGAGTLGALRMTPLLPE